MFRFRRPSRSRGTPSPTEGATPNRALDYERRTESDEAQSWSAQWAEQWQKLTFGDVVEMLLVIIAGIAVVYAKVVYG